MPHHYHAPPKQKGNKPFGRLTGKPMKNVIDHTDSLLTLMVTGNAGPSGARTKSAGQRWDLAASQLERFLKAPMKFRGGPASRKKRKANK